MPHRRVRVRDVMQQRPALHLRELPSDLPVNLEERILAPLHKD